MDTKSTVELIETEHYPTLAEKRDAMRLVVLRKLKQYHPDNFHHPEAASITRGLLKLLEQIDHVYQELTK